MISKLSVRPRASLVAIICLVMAALSFVCLPVRAQDLPPMAADQSTSPAVSPADNSSSSPQQERKQKPQEKDAKQPEKGKEPSPLVAPFDAAQAKAAQEAWAKYLGKPSPVEKNSLGMELVLIPPGQYVMGSPPEEKQRRANEEQVEVTLTRPFYIGKTEITQAQWYAVIGTKPWRADETYPSHGDNFPAINLSWDDTQAFCKRLGKKENATYRLATEAEWEYACRGGTTTRFHTGDEEESLREYEWWHRNGEGHTQEVAKKRPNPFGLHDMHGNVWEWCQDIYLDRHPGGTDPLVTTGNSSHTFRSGVHSIDAWNFRSAFRRSMQPVDLDNGLGFRVVRIVPK